MRATARAAWRGLREVDLATHAFYARAYLLGRPAPWNDAPPDTEALQPWLQRPGRALDVGCGPGRNTLWLAQAGWRVLGVDLYPWVIAEARRAARRRGLEDRARFARAPASALDDLDVEPFDLVLDVLGPTSDLRGRDLAAYGARLARRLAPGGRVLVQTFLDDDEVELLQAELRLVERRVDPVSRWLEFEAREAQDG